MNEELEIYDYMTTKPFNVDWLIDEIASTRQKYGGKLQNNMYAYYIIKDYQHEIIEKGKILEALGYPQETRIKDKRINDILSLVLDLCEIIFLQFELEYQELLKADKGISYEEIINIHEKRIKNREACSTTRASKYMSRAIKEGFIIIEGNHYKWTLKRKSSLAYFLHQIYNPDGTGEIPYTGLEDIFNVTRLDRAVDQMLSAKNPQKWRDEIDNKIFYD